MRRMIDAHLDLAMNLVYYDRDITLNLKEMNEAEADWTDLPFRGKGTTTLPELRAANVAVCIATLLARSGPKLDFQGDARRGQLDYAHPEGAYASCHAQLAYYRLLDRRGEIRLIRTLADYDAHLRAWDEATDRTRAPVGVILSMEGADPVLTPDDITHWHEQGLRAIGLTHYGYSRYGAGTRVEGPLTDAGRAILPHLERLNIALDVTHLSDESMAEAFDHFGGTMWASHHNCRSLVPWDRQLTDEQIKTLASRDGVIGVAADAIMLHPDWVYQQSTPEALKLDIASLVDHIDHVVQLTGSTAHSAIGTDLDGGFGSEQTPRDLKAYRDIRRIEDHFTQRGYNDDAIDAIFFGNWDRLFRHCLPD